MGRGVFREAAMPPQTFPKNDPMKRLRGASTSLLKIRIRIMADSIIVRAMQTTEPAQLARPRQSHSEGINGRNWGQSPFSPLLLEYSEIFKAKKVTVPNFARFEICDLRPAFGSVLIDAGWQAGGFRLHPGTCSRQYELFSEQSFMGFTAHSKTHENIVCRQVAFLAPNRKP
jgi:hypothetical protein